MISKLLAIISFPIIWIGTYISKLVEDVTNLIKTRKNDNEYPFLINLIVFIMTFLFDSTLGIFLAILVPIFVIQEVFNNNNVYFEEAIKRAYFRYSKKKRRESNKLKDDNVIDLDVE